MTKSLNQSSDLTENPIDFYEVFVGVTKEVCPEVEQKYDSGSGSTFYLIPFESEEGKKAIIDSVLSKIREKGYNIGSDWVVDTGNMKWVLFVTTTDDGKKLCWSCQLLYR